MGVVSGCIVCFSMLLRVWVFLVIGKAWEIRFGWCLFANQQQQPLPPPPLPPIVITPTATNAQAQAGVNIHLILTQAVIFLGSIIHPSVGLLGAGIFLTGHVFQADTTTVRGWTGGRLDYLNALPLFREILLNPNPTRPISSFNLTNRRWSYRASAAGQLVGGERNGIFKCSQCHSGHGIFAQCVVVPGLFGAACCNCAYGGHPERCSFYIGLGEDGGNRGGGANRGGKGNGKKGGGRNGGGAKRGVARGRTSVAPRQGIRT